MKKITAFFVFIFAASFAYAVTVSNQTEYRIQVQATTCSQDPSIDCQFNQKSILAHKQENIDYPKIAYPIHFYISIFDAKTSKRCSLKSPNKVLIVYVGKTLVCGSTD